MKKVVVLSWAVLLGAMAPSAAMEPGGKLSGFSCVALNVKGLGLTPEEMWTGRGFPSVLERPDPQAKPIGGVAQIIYVTWPLKEENGFVQVLFPDGQRGWLERKAIRPLRKADGSIGGCSLFRRADGRIMFSLDPGVAVNN